MKKNTNLLIIGAGLSGLSAAALLAKAGFKVSVVEKNKSFGGAAGSFTARGYKFDTGPTWYLMPEVFENYFSLFGKSPDNYYTLKALDPSYRVFYSNNNFVDIRNDIKHNSDVFEKLERNGGSRLRQYLKESEFKYKTAYNEFLYRDYKTIFDFFNKTLIFDGLKLNIFSNLDSYAKKFFKEKKSRQILEFNTVFLGSSPDKTPALYSLMSHADISQGVLYPEGGIHRLPEALLKLGKEYGVKYYFNNTVKKIKIKNNSAVSVITDQDEYQAEILLSACDYHHIETELLDRQYRNYSDKYWKTRTIAPTAFIIFLGIKKKIKALQHHNLYLAENWEDHFDAIFNKPSWPENPCCYIGCPSKTDPAVAPPGCENLFVLAPVAPGLDDSEEIKEKFSEMIISHIEKLTGESVKKYIEYKKIMSHRDFTELYNYYRGTSMGLAHTLLQTAVFRPSHKNKKVKNLYYTGHYTHPGIGMPMAIISSQVVCQLIKKDYL